MNTVFKIKKWLEDEEFQELLKIADYLGQESGYKVFRLNVEKALRNRYLPSDILGTLEELGVELGGGIGHDIEKLYEKHSPVMEWSHVKGVVKVAFTKPVYSVVREYIKRFQHGVIREQDDKVLVEIYPYHAHDVYRYLRDLGLHVVDVNNIYTTKMLVVKPELRDITLRPYQEEALDKWIENKYRGIIALPTGSGKSIIAIAALTRLSTKTLVVTYTKEQMFQWRDFILKYTTTPPYFIGLFYSGEKRLAPITITTYQSGFRNINTLSPHFSLLIVDEVHHLPADKFKHIALHSIAPYRMGLSATPTREDGRHEELFPLLGGIVYYKSPDELIERGYLAPYTIVTMKVKLTPQERAQYESLREKYKSLAGDREFEEILEAVKSGDLRAIEALRVRSEMRRLLANSTSKIEKTIEIASREYANGSKVIIFTQYVDQAKEIARRLNALLLTGDTPGDQRKRFLELFKNASSGILVVTTVGDEGIDIPDANVGILVSGTGSRRQFIQRLGRLLRPKKTRAVLYEIVVEKTSEEYQARRRKSIEIGES